MGQYLNPDSAAFQKILNSKIYVDKSGLLALLNERIGTAQSMVCSTRPRRFGKSLAVQMIAAYYGLAENTDRLFAGSRISREDSYGAHRNRYDVLLLDMVVMCGRTEHRGKLIPTMQGLVLRELRAEYGAYIQDVSGTIESALMDIHLATGKQFVILVDEWDAVFRLYKQDEGLQREYIDFLRSLFKGSSADRFVALAYITGILPIKKYGTQSAMNNFDEFTMLAPDFFAEYTGFTEQEVEALCGEYGLDIGQVREWYDGYILDGLHIYNPRSIVEACTRKKFRNYWAGTETFETLKEYITMNFEGLKDDVLRMLAGEHIDVQVRTFRNDLVSFASRDDVLTVLIHLGYLAYDDGERQAFIPNKEVREEFETAVQASGWTEVARMLERSRQLLRDTLNKNADAVAQALESVHEENTSILRYNDENSLSLVVTLAYLAAKDDYLTVRELPCGKGYADVVFLPRRNTDRPALVVELKRDRNAEGAIRQIKERNYGEELRDYAGRLLLVGINYDSDAGADGKHHTCVIEELEK